MVNRISLGLAAVSLLVSGSLGARAAPNTQEKSICFNISVSLEFKGRIVSQSLRQSDIPKLLDLPVRNGDTDPAQRYSVEMTRSDNSKFKVHTCREWQKARTEGAFSETTYDMAMEGYFIRTCDLLFKLQSAKLPLKSFIANPRVTLANLNLLPAEMLASMPDGEDRDDFRGKTVSDVVSLKNVKQEDPDNLRLVFGGFEQYFQEAARADFNGDGVEDVFVFTGGRAEGGTMGYSDCLILTRTSPSGALKVIPVSNPGEQTAN